LSRILGLSVYHADASAAAVVDGRFVAGVEEERFRRVKHWAGFPERAIRFCLEEMNGGGAGLDGITALGEFVPGENKRDCDQGDADSGPHRHFDERAEARRA